MTISFIPDSPYQAQLQSPMPSNTRITLVSGQPIMTSSVLAATQFFVTPYLGARVPIYNPVDSVWRYELFSEMAFQLNLGTGAQQVTTASNYDVYAYISSSNGAVHPLIAISPAWTGDTTIGTNPGSAERIGVGGILLNRWAIPGGPPAQRGTYLGTIRTGTSAAVDWVYGTTQAGWGPANHCVYNYFNRKLVTGRNGEQQSSAAAATWTWTSNAYRPAAGASTGSRVSAVLGVSEDPVDVSMVCRAGTAVAVFALVGIGVDNFTSASGITSLGPSSGGVGGTQIATFKDLVSAGYHFFQAVEAVGAAGTTATYLAAQSSAPMIQQGMMYSFWM